MTGVASHNTGTGASRSPRLPHFERQRHAPALVLGVGLLTTLALAVYFVRDGYLGVDGLHYIARRGGVPGEDLGLLEPYAGHWQPIPMLLYRGIYGVFGIEPYLPYILMAIFLHLVVCTLLYALMVAVGVSRWVAVASAWLVLFFGAGSEAFLSDAPMALTSSLALGLGAAYLCVRSDFGRRSTVAAAVMLVLGVMCSATGAVTIVLVASLCLASRGLAMAARVAGPALVVYLLWFVAFGRTGGRLKADSAEYLSVPEFVWAGLTAPFGNLIGLPAVGAALTVAVIGAPFVLRADRVELRYLAWAGILAAAAQMSLSSLANLVIGLSAMSAGRYQYIVLVLLLPSVALSLQALATRTITLWPVGATGRIVPVLIASVLLAAVTVHGIKGERSQYYFHTAQSDLFRDWVVGIAAAVDEEERMLTPDTGATLARGEDMLLFARPELRSGLPEGGADDEARVRAEGEFFVGVGPQTYELGAPVSVQSTSFHEPITVQTGCADYTANNFAPSIALDSGLGAQLLVTSDSTSVVTQLQRGEHQSLPRRWGTIPGQPTFIGTSAKGAFLLMTFDAGARFTICTA